MPVRSYYRASVSEFLVSSEDALLGRLAIANQHALDEPQRWAWCHQIEILRRALQNSPDAHLFLEFFIPRMGKRADAVLITDRLIFVLEFKIGSDAHTSSALEQVEDYALDLKNFHEGSHTLPVVPILISTDAPPQQSPR